MARTGTHHGRILDAWEQLACVAVGDLGEELAPRCSSNEDAFVIKYSTEDHINWYHVEGVEYPLGRSVHS